MMMMKDEEVSRLRAAFAAPVSEPWSTGDCPEPDRIWEAVRGELPPDEIRDIVDHVAVCASCAEDWRVAMEFEKESEARQNVRSFPARWGQPWMAAAAAIVLTVAGVYIGQTRKPEPELVAGRYRGEQSKIEALVPPGEVLPRQSFILAWKPVAGAESYDLLITTTEFETIANLKELTATKYQVPADTLASLPAGAQLHWSVTAVFPDGNRELSPTFTAVLE